MSRRIPQLFSLLFFTIVLGCSGGTTDTATGELEIMPRGAEHPDLGECDDWSQDGEGDGCMLDCSNGGSTGPIAWRFECYEVHVVSCKELSNVVVEFEDGTEYKYDGLEGHYGTFGAGEKRVVGAWVKAGNNGSGDGPGYGMRIEPKGDECDDDGAGGTGGDGGSDGAGGMAGHPGTGGGAGSGGMAGHPGTGGMGGHGGDDCVCVCDDDDSDSDSDTDGYGHKRGDDYHDDGDGDSDSDSDSGCDSDGDGDGVCECECVCECDKDIECPQGGKYGYIEVDFECYEVHVASCKELSNVVLELDDGEHRKFDDLDGHCATLGIGERRIVGTWVKAGNNKSGDGPGYGERFDSPLTEEDCDGAGGAGGSGGMAGAGGSGGAGGMAGAGGMGGMAGMMGTGGMAGAGGMGVECTIDDECGVDEICSEGACVRDPDGICVEGLCATNPDVAAECAETFLLCIAAEPFNEEECILAALAVCNVECAVDGDCPVGEVCQNNECVPGGISFAREIQPYFEPGLANCVACHSGGGPKGVDLDSYEAILAGGNSGPLVVPGDSTDPTATLIPKLLEDHNDGPDDAGFVVILGQWIDEGALDN